MAYTIGHVSGCHLNPAVSIGMVIAGRMNIKDLIPYAISQTLGGIAGAGVLYFVASGKPGFDLLANGLATNGYGERSPGGYSMGAGFLTEFLMTFVFMRVILGSTCKKAPQGFAPIAIGLCLTLIHLVAIPITNVSVNPARSIGPALVVGAGALEQLWLFIVAPVLGAMLAAMAYRTFKCDQDET
jgi:aquaporin Z